MLSKFYKKCGFWLFLLSLAQLLLLYLSVNALYLQLGTGPSFKNMPIPKLIFQIGTSLLILLNFHLQLRKACKCSHGYHSKRTSFLLIFLSGIISFGYFVSFLFHSTLEQEEAYSISVVMTLSLIGSASFFLLWLTFTVQYYKIYEYVDSMVKVNNDNGIALTDGKARDLYRVLEYERAYLSGRSCFRRLFNSPVEHTEYYFLQKMIDQLEKFRFSPKNMYQLDDVLCEMRARAEKFSGLSEREKQRYTELAVRFPKIVEPPRDPYYEYDRRVIGNSYCADSKSIIWGGSRNTLL